MTFAIELHWWRGIYISTDLFLKYVSLGFITIAVSKLLVTEALERIKDKLAEEDERDTLGELPRIPNGGTC